ncbi:MAG TPA: hypothetical protein VGE52_09665, partial [Pirellulales bacterium]
AARAGAAPPRAELEAESEPDALALGAADPPAGEKAEPTRGGGEPGLLAEPGLLEEALFAAEA